MNFVLLPKITEKSMKSAQDRNVFTFVVIRAEGNVDKIAVKKYVKDNFKVTVEEVNVANRAGKIKRFGKKRKPYRQKDSKVFMVQLKKGDTIPGFNLTEEGTKKKKSADKEHKHE